MVDLQLHRCILLLLLLNKENDWCNSSNIFQKLREECDLRKEKEKKKEEKTVFENIKQYFNKVLSFLFLLLNHTLLKVLKMYKEELC